MKVLVTLFLVLLARPAFATVDFLDQTLVVDLAKDPATITIQASVDVAVKTDTTEIDLLPTNVPLVSVSWNGTPVKVTPYIDYMVATLPQKAAAGTQGKLTAVLSGQASCPYPGGYIYCMRSPKLTFLTSGGPTAWYLYNLISGGPDPQTGTIKLLLPAGHRAAAMGVPPTVEQGSGTSTWTFTFKRPATEMLFVAGELTEVKSTGGFPTRAVCADDAAIRKVMQAGVDEASRLMPVFGKLWGEAPITELQYGVVTGNTPWAGTSMEGLVLINDMIFLPGFEYIAPQMNHELGHLWWGTMASAPPQSPEYGFFTESLAEYSLWRGRGALEGEAVRDTGSRMNAVWYMYRRPSNADAPVLAKPTSDIYVFPVYHKGSTAVRTLEEAAGVNAIDAGLRDMIKAGPMAASIAAFVKTVQASSGVDLIPYVDKWLKGQGYPILKVTPTVTATATGFQVTLVASGDDYPMQLPVKLRFADGTVTTKTLKVSGGAAKEQFETSARPAVIEIDSGWTAVRELRPALEGDVSMDGRVDGADLIEVALRIGGFLPDKRRLDGKYDPLYDVDGNRVIADADLDKVVARAIAK